MKKFVAILVILLLWHIPSSFEKISNYSGLAIVMKNEELPPPLPLNLTLEECIAKRKSVREFSNEEISMKELATILWAAYGYTDKDRTIHLLANAIEIYVLTNEAVYKYDALNHSLIFYKEGDYRKVSQYEAPIQLGLVWNKSKCPDEYLASAEIGEIGQNIYFAAVALNLGTVTTVGFSLKAIGLPPNEEPKIIMPLGYPEYPYNFEYKHWKFSNLPSIKQSSYSLQEAIEERGETKEFKGNITKQQLSQILWAAYGFSYYVDKVITEKNKIRRHRTVPSAHAYYPIKIYAITKEGIYRYHAGVYRYYMWNFPVLHSIIRIRKGDYRDAISNASLAEISNAPLILISVLDLRMAKGMIGLRDDFSGEQFRWLWYYEAGASAHNVLLEATAWQLAANITMPKDSDTIRQILNLNENFVPLLIVAVGEEN